MRYNYYFQNKGKEKYAMGKYMNLGDHRALQCKDCPGYCESACPYGVLAKPMLAMAHENLEINIT